MGRFSASHYSYALSILGSLRLEAKQPMPTPTRTPTTAAPPAIAATIEIGTPLDSFSVSGTERRLALASRAAFGALKKVLTLKKNY